MRNPLKVNSQLLNFKTGFYHKNSKKEDEKEPLLSKSIKSSNYSWGRILTSCFKTTGAVISSTPNAIFSLLTLSKQPPHKILSAWRAMSVMQKSFSLTAATSALAVNAELNTTFFSQASKRIRKNMKDSSKNMRNLTSTLVSVFFGTGGGIASGALAFEAFEWLPGFVYLITAFNTAVYAASRYLGINSLIERSLDQDVAKVQRSAADKLIRVKQEYIAALEVTLNEAIAAKQNDQHTSDQNQFDDADFEKFFITLAKRLDQIAQDHPDIFEQASGHQAMNQYAGTIFDITLAIFISLFSFVTFSQKGEQGFNLLLKLITNNNLDHLNKGARIALGAIGGVPSSSLYGLSAMDFRSLLIDACCYLHQHPRELPIFTCRLAANMITATGMYYIGANTVSKGNIFSLPSTPFIALTFGAANGLGSFLVNMGPSLKKFAEAPDQANPTCKQIAQYYQNPVINRISKESAQDLQQHALFRPSQIRYDDPVENPQNGAVQARI